MAVPLDAGRLLHEARRRAGLTQRQLATRAATSQSVIARIERGLTSPSITTLRRLLAAAGADAQVELQPLQTPVSHMLDDVSRILTLTPEERLLEVRNLNQFIAGARRV